MPRNRDTFPTPPSMTSLGRRLFLAWLGAAAGSAARAQAPFPSPSPSSVILTRVAYGPEVRRMEEALRQAYAALGISVTYVNMPAERALRESNAGHVDGETVRIGGLEDIYPDLRRVDVPIYINTNSIFVYGANRTVPDSVSQLSHLPRVGIVSGWKASEDATAGWSNVVRIGNYDSAVQLLKGGRIDAFLGRAEDVARALAHEGLNAQDFPGRVIARGPVFHYLNKKNEALIPALTRELRKLQGTKDAVVAS